MNTGSGSGSYVDCREPSNDCRTPRPARALGFSGEVPKGRGERNDGSEQNSPAAPATSTSRYHSPCRGDPRLDRSLARTVEVIRFAVSSVPLLELKCPTVLPWDHIVRSARGTRDGRFVDGLRAPACHRVGITRYVGSCEAAGSGAGATTTVSTSARDDADTEWQAALALLLGAFALPG